MNEIQPSQLEKALKDHFGYDSFRPGQLDLIEALLRHQDVLGIMPTGAGKSICFQIPALFMPGITLVISPLISLMKDQVRALIEAGIPAAYLNSSLTYRQYCKALYLAGQGKYKIIYVAPERLNTPGFRDFASKVKISMIAVDEAHCVSQWGQNFRPSYLETAAFASSLPERPVMAAFTATATGFVRNDMIQLLGLKNPKLLVTGYDRKNLFFEVQRGKSKFENLVRFLENHPHESGIIYCQTRRETEEIANRLNELGYPCGHYHAGMDDVQRTQTQDDFQYDRVGLITATSAFGMGIDKSNVRFVVHYSMPVSLENYYQEAGRAGRDGAQAHCLLLYTPADFMSAKFLVERSNEDSPEQLVNDMIRLRAMDTYCKTPMCLRSYILQYFGEVTSGSCSGCSNCSSEWKETDMTEEAGQIYQCMSSLPYSYGMSTLIDVLRGSEKEKMRGEPFASVSVRGSMKNLKQETVRTMFEWLIMTGFIERSSDKYQTLSLTPAFSELIASKKPVILKTRQEEAARRPVKSSTVQMGQDCENLFELLRACRLELARKESLPPYLIFSDATLQELARRKPASKEEMLAISGVGPVKFKKYGPVFLDLIRQGRTQ